MVWLIKITDVKHKASIGANEIFRFK